MNVGIIILNYNQKSDTIACLQSLQKMQHQNINLNLFLIDNASTDDISEVISRKFPEVNLIVNDRNFGFSKGNNIGIKASLLYKSDFVFILNNDTFVSRDLIVELIGAAEKYPKGGIFSPKIFFAKGYETHNERYKKAELGKVLWYAGGKMDWKNVLGTHRGVDEVDQGQYEEIARVSYASGCAMMIRREVIDNIGMFDEKFFLYYEDVDFCERARKKGWEVFYIPKAYLWHKNAHSSGGTGSTMQDYYITRNRLLIGMRYAPWQTKLALFREAANLLVRGTAAQKQAVGDFLRKKYGKRGEIFAWKMPEINLLKMFKRNKTGKNLKIK